MGQFELPDNGYVPYRDDVDDVDNVDDVDDVDDVDNVDDVDDVDDVPELPNPVLSENEVLEDVMIDGICYHGCSEHNLNGLLISVNLADTSGIQTLFQDQDNEAIFERVLDQSIVRWIFERINNIWTMKLEINSTQNGLKVKYFCLSDGQMNRVFELAELLPELPSI